MKRIFSALFLAIAFSAHAGLETGTYLNDLVSTNPPGTDPRSQGADHLRLIKATAQATFPNMAGRAWRSQSKGSTYTVLTTDNLSLIKATAAITLNFSASATLGNGHRNDVYASSGAVVLTPNGVETINGSATFTVPSGYFVSVWSDGSNLFSTLPSGGAVVGTANQITATLSGATTTLSLPVAVTLPGALTVNAGALSATPANANVTISPTGTGTVTINPTTLGNIDNTRIGFSTRAALQATTGDFNSTLAVTGHTTFEGVTSTGATGTGNLVYSASPTFTGTITAAAANFSGGISSTSTGVAVSLSSAFAGNNVFRIRNTTNGVAAQSGYELGNDVDSAGAWLYFFSSGFTTSGRNVAAGVTLEGAYAGGISIAATNASGAVRLYAGGTSEVGRFTSTGLNSAAIGATTASTGAFTTLSASGNVTLGDAVGDLHVVNGQLGLGRTPTLNANLTALEMDATTSDLVRLYVAGTEKHRITASAAVLDIAATTGLTVTMFGGSTIATFNAAGLSITGLSATTGQFSGLITSTVGNSLPVFTAASATTGYSFAGITNTSGGIEWGVDSSVGGSLVTGSGAYDAAIRTVGAKHLWLATNSGTPQVKIVHQTGARYLILSGSATNPTIDVSAGGLTITPATTLSAALTYGGVTLSNAVTGTGNMVLSASPTFTGNVQGIIVEGTPVATTSGTAASFTSLPSGIKRIVFNLKGVSTNGTGTYRIQLSTSATFKVTGYNGGATSSGGTSGADGGVSCPLTVNGIAAWTYKGSVVLTRESSSNNTWVAISNIYAESGVNTPAEFYTGACDVSLAGALDGIRLTTASDTLDAGEVNIQYQF